MRKKAEKTGSPSVRRYIAARPLWHLAPVRDAKGVLLADFMLLIPRMRARGPAFAEHAAQVLRGVCEQFGEAVCFADINLKTGVIWVSVQARPGLCREVSEAIRGDLPQALSVGGQLGVFEGASVSLRGWRSRVTWISRIRQRVVHHLLPCRQDSGTR